MPSISLRKRTTAPPSGKRCSAYASAAHRFRAALIRYRLATSRRCARARPSSSCAACLASGVARLSQSRAAAPQRNVGTPKTRFERACGAPACNARNASLGGADSAAGQRASASKFGSSRRSGRRQRLREARAKAQQRLHAAQSGYERFMLLAPELTGTHAQDSLRDARRRSCDAAGYALVSAGKRTRTVSPRAAGAFVEARRGRRAPRRSCARSTGQGRCRRDLRPVRCRSTPDRSARTRAHVRRPECRDRYRRQQARRAFVPVDRDVDRPPVRRVAERVVEEVRDQHGEARRVAAHGDVGGAGEAEVDAACRQRAPRARRSRPAPAP